MNKAIITVVGKDRVGIIAGVCTYLAENQINILDITQTLSLIHILGYPGPGYSVPGYPVPDFSRTAP